MSRKETVIPVSFLFECFAPQDGGTLLWKERPRAHFRSDVACARWNRRFAGKIAGIGKQNRGYYQVGLTYCGHFQGYLVHRVILAMANGRWPDEVDHRNGDHADNRLSNLREADRSQQMQNQKLNRLVGASQDNRDGRYQAYINLRKVRTSLGRYDTPEEAHAVYLAAKKHLHTFQPEIRD